MARGHGTCGGLAVDVHEVKSRGRGGSIVDPDNCIALCRSCHDWVTTHPALALEYGMLAHAWTPEAEVAERIARGW